MQAFEPKMKGIKPDPKRIKELLGKFKQTVQQLEDYYLKDHKFIHSDEISIADLQAVTELTQFWALGLDPVEDKPRLARWVADCRDALQSTFDEVYSAVYSIRDQGLLKGMLDLKGK